MTGNLMLRAAVKAVAIGAIACAGATTLGGCYATVQPDYVEAPAPPNIETYPSVVYEGHPTYFYNNRWYYRGNGGAWVNYRSEPAELQRRRGEVMNRRPAEGRPEGRGEVRGEVRVEEHR